MKKKCVFINVKTGLYFRAMPAMWTEHIEQAQKIDPATFNPEKYLEGLALDPSPFSDMEEKPVFKIETIYIL